MWNVPKEWASIVSSPTYQGMSYQQSVLPPAKPEKADSYSHNPTELKTLIIEALNSREIGGSSYDDVSAMWWVTIARYGENNESVQINMLTLMGAAVFLGVFYRLLDMFISA